MHLEHNDHSDTSEHVAGVHSTSILHDFDLPHHDSFLDENHHPVTLDVNPDNLIQKINLLNPLILILLFIGFLLIRPRIVYRLKQRPDIKRFTSRYYLFQPPLRAPPLI